MLAIEPVILVTFCILTTARGFNIDTKFPIIFSGPRGSYFGFSVALHRNKEGVLALITAPRANSSYYSKKVHQPGALFKCTISTSLCEEILLDPTENSNYQSFWKGVSYFDLKNDSWLGISLDVQPIHGNVVTCGHLWKNQKHRDNYFANGVCYILNKDLDTSNVQKLLPLTRDELIYIKENNSDIAYYYANGMVGFSSSFSADGNNLILGAPGIYDWKGTVVDYTTSDIKDTIGRPTIPKPNKFNIGRNTQEDTYIGYSVTSGNFFSNGKKYVVASAPRDGRDFGRVYIMRYPLKQNFEFERSKTGEQNGEYYGAVVLGVNINNDKYTDLLVSAPLYSSRRASPDEGRVYVYISDGLDLHLQREKLVGKEKSNARFGSALAEIGDINYDGYNDIAIGAPYEEEGGAVYIYHGESKGIKPEFSQRILASDIDKGLRGFGIGIAKGVDADFNFYSDLLVGSYASDQAVLLRTRPVVQVKANIVFHPTQISTNSTLCFAHGNWVPCVNVTGCLLYQGEYVPDRYYFDISLEIDSNKPQNVQTPRGYFHSQGIQNTISKISTRVSRNIYNCFMSEVFITASERNQDLITPIQFTLSYNISERSGKSTFCKECPILDAALSNSIHKLLPFQTGCGEDNICLSDLNVKPGISGIGSNNYLLIGQNTSITLNVAVTNKGDPAYLTELHITIPPEVDIINQAQCSQNENINTEINATLTCAVGNPLLRDQTAIISLRLDISKIPYTAESIEFHFRTATASEETTPEDNTAAFFIPLRSLADVAIFGQSDVSEILFQDESSLSHDLSLVHSYIVTKYLPSPIQSVEVAFFVPVHLKEKRVEFLKISKIQVDDTRTASVSASCNFENYNNSSDKQIADKSEKSRTPLPVFFRQKRSTKEDIPATENVENYDGLTVLNCNNSECQRINCLAGPFPDNSKFATFRISMIINTNSLTKAVGKWNTIVIQTEGYAKILDNTGVMQPEYHHPDYDMISTRIQKLGKKQIARWIIPVSIAAGTLLLIIIIVTLVKSGFFRRQKREEMQKLMQQSEMDEWEKNIEMDDEVNKGLENPTYDVKS